MRLARARAVAFVDEGHDEERRLQSSELSSLLATQKNRADRDSNILMKH